MASSLKSPSAVSTAEQVLNRLTKLIEERKLKAGAHLPAERELAVRFGVCRGAVREATTRLEASGLVKIRQGIGVEIVNRVELPVEQTIARLLRRGGERLSQCAQARLLIEPELAALAAVRATPSAVVRLRKGHESFGGAVSMEAAVAGDMAFHDVIATIAGNKVLALMLKSISELGRMNREITLRKVGLKKGYRHHGEILAAIAAGDAARARLAMKRHLQAARSDLD